MGQFALTNVAAVTPFTLVEDATILIDKNKILDIGPVDKLSIPPGFRKVPLDGLLVAPGFIDQHIHGSSGASVMDGTPESIMEIAKFQATHGVTAFLATTTAGTHNHLLKVARALAKADDLGYKGARCMGLHLEGPYLSPKYAGINYVNYLRLPSLEEIMEIQYSSSYGIKLITMAPELPGALEIIPRLAQEGIAFSTVAGCK